MLDCTWSLDSAEMRIDGCILDTILSQSHSERRGDFYATHAFRRVTTYIREYRTLTHKLQRSDQRVHQALLYAHDHEDVAPGLVRLRSCCSPSSLLSTVFSSIAEEERLV